MKGKKNILNTDVKNAILATDKEEQYDSSAKRLLANKEILAYILVNTVKEFEGMNPKEVILLIEGEPYVSSIAVEPGLTNCLTDKSGLKIVGMNTEDVEKNEGLIRYDIVFYVRMKDGLSKMIINVEAQKDEPQNYDILNRAVFYVSRLISSQNERDFEKTNYNDIKSVYSIWVCMNMDSNSLCHIHLNKDDLIGNQNWKGNLNLINIVMIGLTDGIPNYNTSGKLHRLLAGLFSNRLSVKEKFTLLSEEYNISLDDDVRKDVNTMCNLSQGIKEEGRLEGRLEERINLIIKIMKKGMPLEQIANLMDEPEENIMPLYEVVKMSGPEYDIDKIMKILKNNSQTKTDKK